MAFAAIMSEQLAMKLQSTEEDPWDKQEEEDFRLALELSLQENGDCEIEHIIKNLEETTAIDPISKDHPAQPNDDYLAALHWQKIYDDEAMAWEQQLQRKKNTEGGGAKVVIQYNNYADSLLTYEDEDEDQSDEDYDEDYDETIDYKLKTNSKGNMITKHDLGNDAKLHARKIENLTTRAGNMSDKRVPSKVFNKFQIELNKTEKTRIRVVSKEQKSTLEQVLDPRTRLLLQKLVNTGVLTEVHGCISSGKEANVYFARGDPNSDWRARVEEKLRLSQQRHPKKKKKKKNAKSKKDNKISNDNGETCVRNNDCKAQEEAPAIPSLSVENEAVETTNQAGDQVEDSSSVPNDNAKECSAVLKEPSGELKEYAVKIYKTMLNTFTNRAPYIQGEYAYRTKYSSKAKEVEQINVWAEKELHNLKKIKKAGIPCPEVVVLKKHILVMEMVGDKNPAPQLKEIHRSLSNERMRELYVQCIKIMRKLYQTCKLVHADLSEYNLLYHRSKLHVIDVAQAVSADNPQALDFLRRDCDTITSFFRKAGIDNTMNVLQLFQFITDKNILEQQEDQYLESVQNMNDSPLEDKQVFLKSYIPATLHDLDPVSRLQNCNKVGNYWVSSLSEASVDSN